MLPVTLLSSLRGRVGRVPSISLAHRPLTQGKHDFLFHLVNVLLQISVVLLVLLPATPVEVHPAPDDESRDGNRNGEVDPELDRDDGVGI